MAMPQINVVMANNNTAVGQAGAVAVAARKSVFLALVLTFFFGPLGMFYSTVKGAVIMLIISTVLALLTAGISIAITWPVSIIWGAVAADAHNKRGVVV
jgi:fatty acid desaturase